ncbi:MAG: Crp/Fnr family transcriptional regulator [Sphingobacteriales bacterium]|nr:MAG: Crp/Fnr family transcriptional regulator [Sphingobacteriales bacterium]
MDTQFIIQQLEEFGITPAVRVFKRGEYIFRAGATTEEVYFIKDGSVLVSCDLGQDTEQIIRFGYAGSLITALDTYLSGKASIYSIEAIRQSTVWIIAREAIERFWNSSIERQQLWQAIIEALVLQQMEREIDLLIAEPRLRYQRVLARSPQLFQEVPQKYIANYLRMTPETLSRLQKS